MKIAYCHLDLSCGDKTQNIAKLLSALTVAGEKGADMVLTPETAVQGYYFYKREKTEQVAAMPDPDLDPLREMARKYGYYLFLGAAEKEAALRKDIVLKEGDRSEESEANKAVEAADSSTERIEIMRNSCLVFGPTGDLIGRHCKMNSHAIGSEGWVANAPFSSLEPVKCGELSVGVLVCSDAWYLENSLKLAEMGADIIIDIAAWPPSEICGNPFPRWVECSEKTQLPFIICNQTGTNPWMDMTEGQSVFINCGNPELEYNGREALLLCDWDENKGDCLSKEFEVVILDDKFR